MCLLPRAARFLGTFVCFASLTQAIEVPLRINAGGPSLGEKDSLNYWVSDREFVEGGDSFSFGGKHDTRHAEDPGPAKLYQTVRHRDHTYTIKGLKEGLYRVRFHFTDGKDSGKRAMDYRIDGALVINNFSPARAAGGMRQVHIIEVLATVRKREPLVIRCLADKGDDVFEAGLEILPDTGERLPPPAAGPRPDPGAASTAAAIRKLTGAPTRFVWSQSSRGHHSVGPKDLVRLMAFDTEDGFGERLLLPDEAAYAKPLFTPDGLAVVFTDRKKRTIFRIDWDGTHLTDLGPGYATDVWRDPATGRDWVYFRGGDGVKSDAILRRPMDGGGKDQVVWDHTENGHQVMPWFQLSADGLRFSDAFPWPRCGTGDLTGDDWEQLATGCWPGIAPDNSYRSFVFAGSHTEVTMFESGGARPRKIDLSKVPGREGRKLYFPRWSNDVRFLTVSSPEDDPKAELYVGKFDPQWDRVESWVQVTHNQRADIFGDAWIRPDKGPAPGSVAVSGTPIRARPVPDQGPAMGKFWPGTNQGLLWIWDNAKAKNEAPKREGEKRPFSCTGDLKGRARYGPWHELRLGTGSFVAEHDAGSRVVSAWRRSGVFSLEMLLTPLSGTGRGGILCVGSGSLSLVQQDEDLELVLPDQQTISLGKLAVGRTSHVLLSATAGQIRAWVDGKESPSLPRLKTLPTQWDSTGMALTLGDLSGGGLDWKGALEKVALYDRGITADEALQHHTLSRQSLEGRKAPPQAEIEARLVEATVPPGLDEIGTYRRALVENVYEVTAVKSGDLAKVGDQIVALQWVIMDGKLLPSAAELEPGQATRMRLEPAADHPELEGEFRSSDHSAFEATVFLDVTE